MDRLECFHPTRCATCWHHRDDVGCTLQGKVSQEPKRPRRVPQPSQGQQVTLRGVAVEAIA